MTWIRTIPIEEADEKLRNALEAARAGYPKEYERSSSPGGDSVVASHTLIPDAMHHIFAGFAAMMSPDLPLSRAQHEMIATMVSVENRCFY
jgi:ribosomal protein S12 methylthiotransferase accessory factor YcaO